MKTAFIIHGSSCTIQNHWYPWLKGELEKRGYEVIVPQFPDITHENFHDWYEVFKPYEGRISEESIFVGHSLGTAFLLQLLTQGNFQAKGLYLVGAFGERFSEEEIQDQYKLFAPNGDEIPYEAMYYYESFVDGIDFEKVKRACEKKVIIHAKNDPYVSPRYAENLHKYIGGELVLYSHAGHFCDRDGYKEFRDLLDRIEG